MPSCEPNAAAWWKTRPVCAQARVLGLAMTVAGLGAAPWLALASRPDPRPDPLKPPASPAAPRHVLRHCDGLARPHGLWQDLDLNRPCYSYVFAAFALFWACGGRIRPSQAHSRTWTNFRTLQKLMKLFHLGHKYVNIYCIYMYYICMMRCVVYTCAVLSLNDLRAYWGPDVSSPAASVVKSPMTKSRRRARVMATSDDVHPPFLLRLHSDPLGGHDAKGVLLAWRPYITW